MCTLDELLEACSTSVLGEQARWTIRPFRFEQNLDPRLLFRRHVGAQHTNAFASVVADSKHTTMGDCRVLNSKCLKRKAEDEHTGFNGRRKAYVELILIRSENYDD